jgi:hypothetical protein
MSARKDETGNVYGSLTVKSFSHVRNGKSHWVCECACGTICIVAAGALRRQDEKRTTSCGCFKNAGTHGLSKSPEYSSYHSMIARCYNEGFAGYRDYGGRGITICEKWIGQGGFERWFAHIGPRPSRMHSQDRINPNGNYQPGNVRWATKSEQTKNRRRILAIENQSLEDLRKEALRRGFALVPLNSSSPLPSLS